MSYLYLAIAIVAEVIATSAMKATEGFTRPLPTAITVLGYVCAFYCFSLVLQSMSLGVAYAVWCGLGIVLVAGASAMLYREIPDPPAMIGMALIMAGVVVINVFSRTVNH